MNKNSEYKKLITICCIYEAVAFLTLYTHDFCDLWLYPCGLQYIILCVIIPIFAILLWVWKESILKTYVKYSNIIIIFFLCISLGLYLFFRPVILNFSDIAVCNTLEKTTEELCVEQERKYSILTDNYDIKDKCERFAFYARFQICGNVLTKKQFQQRIAEAKDKFVDYPYYSTSSCEHIAQRENSRLKTSWGRANCISNVIAFTIKKNLIKYVSDKEINKNLYSIRDAAEKYCDDNTKEFNTQSDSVNFCKANNLN